MKTILEKDVQKSIKDYLSLLKIFCWKQNSSGIHTGSDDNKRWIPSGLVGVSDIIGICPDGRFLAIEVKREGGKVSEAQHLFIENIRRNKGVAFVAHSVDEVKKYLKEFNVI